MEMDSPNVACGHLIKLAGIPARHAIMIQESYLPEVLVSNSSNLLTGVSHVVGRVLTRPGPKRGCTCFNAKRASVPFRVGLGNQ